MKQLTRLAVSLAMFSMAAGAQAALVNEGGGVILDNVNNLLWYTDGTDRNWANATSWSAGLTQSSLSAGSWSLGTFTQYNLLAAAAGSVSQMNTLGFTAQYYFLSTTAHDLDFEGLPNVGSNNNTDGLKVFDFYDPAATIGSLAVAQYTPPAVPVPASAWLLGSGLLGLVGISRRRAV